MTSFGEAFAAARKKLGPGKTFTWKGKEYTTDRADDKKEPVKPKANPRNEAPKVNSEAPKMGENSTAGAKLKTTVKSDAAEKAAFEKEKDRLQAEEYAKRKPKKKRMMGDFGKNIYTSANKA